MARERAGVDLLCGVGYPLSVCCSSQVVPLEGVPMTFVRRIAAAALFLTVLPLLQAQTSAKSSKAAATASTQPAAGNSAAAGEKLDINTATADQLKSFNGIGDAYAKRIMDGRPYTMKTQLVTKGVLPQATYNKIKDNIVASKVKK